LLSGAPLGGGFHLCLDTADLRAFKGAAVMNVGITPTGDGGRETCFRKIFI